MQDVKMFIKDALGSNSVISIDITEQLFAGNCSDKQLNVNKHDCHQSNAKILVSSILHC